MASTTKAEYRVAEVTLLRVLPKSIICTNAEGLGVEMVIGRSTLSFLCDARAEAVLKFPAPFKLEAMTWLMDKYKL